MEYYGTVKSVKRSAYKGMKCGTYCRLNRILCLKRSEGGSGIADEHKGKESKMSNACASRLLASMLKEGPSKQEPKNASLVHVLTSFNAGK